MYYIMEGRLLLGANNCILLNGRLLCALATSSMHSLPFNSTHNHLVDSRIKSTATLLVFILVA